MPEFQEILIIYGDTIPRPRQRFEAGKFIVYSRSKTMMSDPDYYGSLIQLDMIFLRGFSLGELSERDHVAFKKWLKPTGVILTLYDA